MQTPGPWKVIMDADNPFNRRVVSFHPSAIAKVYGWADDDAVAIGNANLIAAAPDLYEMLTIALGVIVKSGIIWMGEDKARAALAKAHGDPV